MNRNEMIDLLIDSDINDWNAREDQEDYFAMILRRGFVGYENQSDYELKEECLERGIIDSTHLSFDPVLKNEV